MSEVGWRAWRWPLLAGAAGILLLVSLGLCQRQTRAWWRETAFSKTLITPQVELEERLGQIARANRERLNLFCEPASAEQQVRLLFDAADSLDLFVDNFVAHADKRQGKLERQQIRLECSGAFRAHMAYLRWLERGAQAFHVKEVFLVRVNDQVAMSVDGYLLRALD